MGLSNQSDNKDHLYLSLFAQEGLASIKTANAADDDQVRASHNATSRTQNDEELKSKFDQKYDKLKNKLDEFKKESDDKIKKIREEYDKLNESLISSQRKSIEIIGIISSIIGLGLSFVSVAKDQRDVFASAIILLLTACAFAIFATLMHWFFGDRELDKDAKQVVKWTISLAAGLLFLAIMGQNQILQIMYKIIYPL